MGDECKICHWISRQRRAECHQLCLLAVGQGPRRAHCDVIHAIVNERMLLHIDEQLRDLFTGSKELQQGILQFMPK